jgi:hypothetical protein
VLHKINLPDCITHLDWIVQLQGDLLRALCNPGVEADEITVNWVKGIRPDVDGDWMRRFCNWSTGQNSMLDRMKAVAGLAETDKQAIALHYETNLQFPDAFDDTKEEPPAAKPLQDSLSPAASAAYRDFFEMFYDPIFYAGTTHKGYPVEDVELGKRFSKSVYLEAYHEANEKLKVCPLCDGSMDGAQLDHWLAKQYMPELNCHPLNLVEICQVCNDVTNKGKKLTLDQSAAQPFADWFHPHLREAEGSYNIEIRKGGPVVIGINDETQRRLENLDNLVNLTKRWTRKYDNLVTSFQNSIRHHSRRGRTFDRPSLLDKVREWLVEAEANLGHEEYKLLKMAVLRKAEEDGSDVFEELW